ncbi:hypothetical protein H2201_006111 [Coniosporium apollinis]|uniref:Folliculin-interacting protein N-terminal domain-containing protein n=1 Tax=Coniosporium apollinis TaxID=61459 RepID=A0ABQ9NT75_9PEZI|nr:hypothetical protein H2201_006111 [Coniosporium apollinis]
MLGQLFHRRGSQRQHAQVESSTEDSHTRNLLFPEASVFHQPEAQAYPLPAPSIHSGSPGSGFYDSTLGEIDLEQARDIRILVAQDDAGNVPRTILFDSKPGSEYTNPASSPTSSKGARGSGRPQSPRNANAGTTGHSRTSSLVSTPRSPIGSAFQRSRTRNASISSMPGIEESSQSSRAKDPDDLIKTCLDCMFGNTAMSYRGPSNKIHIIPLDSRSIDSATVSPIASDGYHSFGKAEGRRRSKLAKSFTPANPPPELSASAPTAEGLELPGKTERRRTILITRTFSVAGPEDTEVTDSSNARTPTPRNPVSPDNSYPFPRVPVNGPASQSRRRRVKPRKSPMYAITIIISLPVASSSTPSRSNSQLPRPGSLKPGSLPGRDSLGSSFDSDRRAGWAFVDPAFGVDSLLSASFCSDVDDRVDVVGQHWDVITRTLTSLQFAVQGRILAVFKQLDAAVPLVKQPTTDPSRIPNRELHLTYSRPQMLMIEPYALMTDGKVKAAVELAAERVVRGLRIPRVATGQGIDRYPGRWGVWREEARWLGRYGGGKEQNYFFFNLMTAFLGNHTEWLDILGPKWARRKHREQQKVNAGEDMTLYSRTIIVSDDKMAARRWIFLLAAFLPAYSHPSCENASPPRPGTSSSVRGYSQSPPTTGPVSRQQSLRRTINRKNKGSQPNMRSGLRDQEAQSVNSDDKTEIAVQGVIEPMHQSGRRASDARSIMPANLHVPAVTESVARKSSSATPSTVTPETAVPVVHFTVQRTNSGMSVAAEQHRPQSSSSLASVNLIHTLQRNNTANASSSGSQGGSRWGSLMSLWSGSNRRSSSTDHSDILQSTDDGLGIMPYASRRPLDLKQPSTKLEQMVQELAVADGELYQEDLESYAAAAADECQTSLTKASDPSLPLASPNVPIPERPKAPYTPPLKLSVNEKDGVIDVEIPFPSFGSPMQSPSMGGFASESSAEGSSFGHSSFFYNPHRENEQPVNVAGWLGTFHPDFALQGVRPYPELDKEIRRAMSAEPTPVAAAATSNLYQGPVEKWVDVCTSLIADCRTFTVKRIKLRRLVRLIPPPSQPGTTPGLSAPPRSQYGNPYLQSNLAAHMPEAEIHLDEEFTEEPIVDTDDTLMKALEKALAVSGPNSRNQSASSSRSSSRRGRQGQRSGSDVTPTLDIPRGECKQLVFGALEQVVKSVKAEREAQGKQVQGQAHASEGGKGKVKAGKAAESTLKEGVRKWLNEVE